MTKNYRIDCEVKISGAHFKERYRDYSMNGNRIRENNKRKKPVSGF
jgi:hypothetical protein